MTDSAVDYLKPGWEQVAQAELRERQGKGARYDAEGAPHELLSLARRGTAYFLRQLNQLSDEDLDGPSGLPGWSRRHLVAHVGYNARALAHLAYWARTGIETPMYASPTARDDQIRLGASLPARALRHLIDHSWIHLNVEWRDLTTEQWGHHVQTFQGRDIEARETPWMRAKEVWCHAVDLSPAGSYLDFPPDVLAGIGRDVLGSWERRGETPDVTLRLQDGPAGFGAAPDSDTVIVGRGRPVVSGTRADIVRWLAGRGARRLAASGVGALPELPRWF